MRPDFNPGHPGGRPWTGRGREIPLLQYQDEYYTAGANLAGLAGLSLPCGLVDGPPVGVQLLAPAGRGGPALLGRPGFWRRPRGGFPRRLSRSRFLCGNSRRLLFFPGRLPGRCGGKGGV